ncbi:MAG: MoaD/ThiS family protein [Flavobacteriales bacterium]|nr:MoaD/ThiS family protein [Flavobacteriales bacterium]
MILRLKYFGMIVEALGKETEELNLDICTVAELKNNYKNSLANINYKVAVNYNLVEEEYMLNENDEVALLPPFAGG